MAIQIISSDNSESKDFDLLLKTMSQFDISETIIITPSLDAKKSLVDFLAQNNGTVPDNMVLRLSELFVHLVKKIKPDIEFLDKKLFQLYFKQELFAAGSEVLDQFQIEKAIEYISVYSPIIANSRYRVIFEDYINEDPGFKNIYAEIYPLMVQIWDIVVKSPYLIKQWSLGYLFQNIDQLQIHKFNIVVYKSKSLKKVELDFFEELSNYVPVYFLKNIYETDSVQRGLYKLDNIDLNQNKEVQRVVPKNLKNKYFWHKVVTPLDEIETVCQVNIRKIIRLG